VHRCYLFPAFFLVSNIPGERSSNIVSGVQSRVRSRDTARVTRAIHRFDSSILPCSRGLSGLLRWYSLIFPCQLPLRVGRIVSRRSAEEMLLGMRVTPPQTYVQREEMRNRNHEAHVATCNLRRRDSGLKQQQRQQQPHPKHRRRTDRDFYFTTSAPTNRSKMADNGRAVPQDPQDNAEPRARGYVTRALRRRAGMTVASDHVAIDLDQGYQRAISDPLI